MHLRFPFFPAPLLIAALFALTSKPSPAQTAPCVAGTDVVVEPGDHPATVLQASGASCRVHYKDAAFPDGWTYDFNIVKQPRGVTTACIVGNHVLVDPGSHPATVLQTTGASCRLHYDDGAFPDGWTYTFNVKAAAPAGPAAPPAANPKPVAANGLQLGRYNITVGSGASDGYLVLRSATSYELFLPGGKSGGAGSFSYDAAHSQLHWISGPLTNATWDGTQKLEHDANFAKIRIGKRTVATLKLQ